MLPIRKCHPFSLIMVGSVFAAALIKHSDNDAQCSELRWTFIDLVMESYGGRDKEAVQDFSRPASHLATPKSKVVSNQYGHLNKTLVRANAQALILRGGY